MALALTTIKPVNNSLLSAMWALGKYCFVKMSSSPFSCTVFLYTAFAPPPQGSQWSFMIYAVLAVCCRRQRLLLKRYFVWPFSIQNVTPLNVQNEQLFEINGRNSNEFKRL
jgi:hypothetical protein